VSQTRQELVDGSLAVFVQGTGPWQSKLGVRRRGREAAKAQGT